MYSHTQRRSTKLTQELRAKAGRWLLELRERRGLTQRELARMIGAEYHTFISQLEHGRGRIPPDRYLVWADALGVEPREFVRTLMSYYDPVTHNVLYNDGAGKSLPCHEQSLRPTHWPSGDIHKVKESPESISSPALDTPRIRLQKFFRAAFRLAAHAGETRRRDCRG
jgi:transcriptional regulator with XRE-family HTH domain